MKGEKGFTYMALLVSMFIVSISMTVVGPSLRMMAKTERETELIWRGHQFRLAIKKYFNYHRQDYAKRYGEAVVAAMPASHFYPSQKEDLIKDPISPGTLRHLRKFYTDPITGKDDWVAIQREGGRIVGFRSNSDGETTKRDNFDLQDYKFKGKTRYSEWEFVYDPNDPYVK